MKEVLDKKEIFDHIGWCLDIHRSFENKGGSY